MYLKIAFKQFVYYDSDPGQTLTLSPMTVGRSVSGELAVILCVAITPGSETGEDRRVQSKYK